MPKNKGKVRSNTSPKAPPHIPLSDLWSPLLTSSYQGGKNRRRGKNENDNEKRELTFKEEGQEYAQVLKMLGNGRLEALCFDGEKRLAHIRVRNSPPFAHLLLSLGQ
jgi:hypothetical protein